MRLLSMRCPSCGGIIDGGAMGGVVTCEYCGSRFALDEEEANVFAKSMSPESEDEIDDGESSSLSMTESAEQACSAFLAHRDNGSSFRSSTKIIRGLNIGDDRVFLIHDDTFMKSGKNGFAITDRGIYCRDMGEDPDFVSWSEFGKMAKPHLEDSHIYSNGITVCYFTDSSETRPYLLELYEKLHRHAKKNC